MPVPNAYGELLKPVLWCLYLQFSSYFVSLLGSLHLQHFIYPDFTWTLLIVTGLRKLLGFVHTCGFN